jgi:hypothetical protein
MRTEMFIRGKTMKRKCLAVGIILLFVAVTIAPTINFNTVKASTDDDLVKVTTQACGIKGYGDTTVKLTREQYQNLEEYLVEFRARLNQTSTREEAVPIFKDAVVELDKYGLLGGLSVEKAQMLVVGPSQNTIVNNMFRKVSKVGNFSGIDNHLCLVLGRMTQTYPLGVFGYSSFIIYFLWFFSVITRFPFLHFLPFQLIGPVTFGVTQINHDMSKTQYYYYPAQGWMTATGLNGLTQISGPLYGTLGDVEVGFAGYWTYYSKGMNSFTGLTIYFQGEILLLGFTFHLGLIEYTPP